MAELLTSFRFRYSL